jgi:hypothetical protein
MADYLDRDYNYVVVKDLVYNTNYYNATSMNHDPRLFDIYWNLDKHTNQIDTTYRPAIIYVHGGGFWYNNKNGGEARTIGYEFASRGYRVMAINYRLEGDPIKACQDVKAAVRYLRFFTQAARVIPNKICVIGDSAGGIAALLSIVSDYETSNGTLELTSYTGVSSLSRPNACVSMWAPYNTGFAWAGGVTGFNFNVTPTSTYIASGFLDKVFFLQGNLDNIVTPPNFYNLTGVIKTIKGSFPTTASAVLLNQSGHSAWGDNQIYVFPPVGNGPPAAGSLPNEGFINTGLSSVVPWLKTQLGL